MKRDRDIRLAVLPIALLLGLSSAGARADDCNVSYYCYGNATRFTEVRVVNSPDPNAQPQITPTPVPARPVVVATAQPARPAQPPVVRPVQVARPAVIAARPAQPPVVRPVQVARPAVIAARPVQPPVVRPNPVIVAPHPVQPAAIQPSVVSRPPVIATARPSILEDTQIGVTRVTAVPPIPMVSIAPPTPVVVNPISVVTPSSPLTGTRPVQNCGLTFNTLMAEADGIEKNAFVLARNQQRDQARALFLKASNLRERAKNLNCQVM